MGNILAWLFGARAGRWPKYGNIHPSYWLY
jgi:hypothetical protein